MNPRIKVKICGLSRVEEVSTAVAAGADYIGFVFFPSSPRYVTVEQAGQLSRDIPDTITRVALTVDASDREIGEIVGGAGIDMLQLHGRESTDRVSEIKKLFGLPVMKVVGIRDANDLQELHHHAQKADQLLLDAKPATKGQLPGGNGLSFDWDLIAGLDWNLPWMLAGGLDPSNVAAAISLTNANQVDVSTGVEIRPGVKDSKKIYRFIQQAKEC